MATGDQVASAQAGPVAIGDQDRAATVDQEASAQAGPVAVADQDRASGDQDQVDRVTLGQARVTGEAQGATRLRATGDQGANL